MFNIEAFATACQGKPASAVKELLTDALRNPVEVKQALDAMGQTKPDRRRTPGRFRDPSLP